MKNRAAYMVGLNKMEIRETPVPEPKAGEVLVKIEYVGICGSDVHYFKDGRCGDFVVDGELMLGHEAGGVVEKHLGTHRALRQPPEGGRQGCIGTRYHLRSLRIL